MIPKFRAYHKELKMMFEVKSLVYTLRLARLTNRNDLVPSRTCSFDDIILMQSTGLFDKNGVEVFEGDILYYPEQDEDKYGYIEFDKDRLAFVLDNGFEKFFYGEYGMGYIVGNIYENPELLEIEND
ncbi:YopX family protein [Streptococcus uberis]|uniref:YopX family protein n=1 Tax=Streptococcus uberis TaxID=1349 RepID=UPI0027DAF976|nr:YopX family protein [Streptococcus uberis]MCK1239866.1 YopX family protein [Streptococcus uberis]